jgi:hypothetical protein
VTVLRNNFDGGPDGTVITTANSGQVPGNDAFDFVQPQGSGMSMQFASAAALGRATAEYVMNIATAATSGQLNVIWSTSMGSQTQVWWRYYMYLVALPTATANNPTIFEMDNGAAYGGVLLINKATNSLRVVTGSGATSTFATGAVALSAGRWYRIEGRYQAGTGTSGSCDVRLFDEPDDDTPAETISLSGVNMGTTSANSFTFGWIFNDVNYPHMYMSGLELNNTDWPGPAPPRLGKGTPAGNLTNPVAIHQSLF